MYDGHGFGFGGGVMWLFWLLLIGIIVWVIKQTTTEKTSVQDAEKDSALQILKERYARGDIDEEEYEKKRAHLKS